MTKYPKHCSEVLLMCFMCDDTEVLRANCFHEGERRAWAQKWLTWMWVVVLVWKAYQHFLGMMEMLRHIAVTSLGQIYTCIASSCKGLSWKSCSIVWMGCMVIPGLPRLLTLP